MSYRSKVLIGRRIRPLKHVMYDIMMMVMVMVMSEGDLDEGA